MNIKSDESPLFNSLSELLSPYLLYIHIFLIKYWVLLQVRILILTGQKVWRVQMMDPRAGHVKLLFSGLYIILVCIRRTMRLFCNDRGRLRRIVILLIIVICKSLLWKQIQFILGVRTWLILVIVRVWVLILRPNDLWLICLLYRWLWNIVNQQLSYGSLTHLRNSCRWSISRPFFQNSSPRWSR